MNHITPIRSISENYWRTGHWLNGRLGTATLADTLAAILDDHGFHDYDVSEVTGDLGGYVQGDLASARSLIEPLAEAFLIEVIEDGTVLRFRSRAAAGLAATAIPVLADIEGEPLWRETRGHDSDFAAEAMLTFYDPAADYAEASVRSRRVEAATTRQLARDLAAVIPEETALAAAEAMLRDHRVGRRRLELSLGPGELEVQPGDILSFPEGPAGRFLVEEIDDGTARRLTLREVAAATSALRVSAADGRITGNPASAGFAPLLAFMDLPQYEAGEAASFARVAGFCRPWRRIAISASVEAEGYGLRTIIERPATMGALAAPMVSGVSGRFDMARPVDVTLSFGGLSSASRLAVLNGANRIAVRSNDGSWEILAFAGAEEIAEGRWRLTALLRGLAGTEDAMAAGAAEGATVVLLDEAVKPLDLAGEEAGLALNYIAEAVGGVVAAKGPFVFTGGMRAETPIAPVHLRATRAPEGGIALGWVRRGRVDADNWLGADIPLDEVRETYRVEILDEDTVVRTVEADEARWIYPQALELVDFGAAQTSLRFRVRQIGRVAAGIIAEAVVAVE
ncbi:hypothetical protein ACO34A_07370 [Rhizobium sp. ACO-34A]|nr:phage tail protein [Rhizobium sp. ACO-34A]ATN33625.1 hypothetical protein ACO34A_07370 [Rhizobium sp. ACO-34A]